jgi:hypothetical protein
MMNLMRPPSKGLMKVDLIVKGVHNRIMVMVKKNIVIKKIMIKKVMIRKIMMKKIMIKKMINKMAKGMTIKMIRK